MKISINVNIDPKWAYSMSKEIGIGRKVDIGEWSVEKIQQALDSEEIVLPTDSLIESLEAESLKRACDIRKAHDGR